MPIYEYRCGACGEMTDALQKIADPPLEDCPSCSAAALRRLISAPAFRLKGSGWYETDFKSDKEKKRNLAETSKEPEKSDKPDKPDKPDKSDKTDKPKSSDAGSSKPGADKPAAKKPDPKAPKGKGTEAA